MDEEVDPTVDNSLFESSVSAKGQGMGEVLGLACFIMDDTRGES